MKVTLLLSCSIIFIFLVSMDLSLTDEIGSDLRIPTLYSKEKSTVSTPSLFGIAKDKLQNTLSLLDRKKEEDRGSNPPASLLLLTGLFGFAFWGRASSTNG